MNEENNKEYELSDEEVESASGGGMGPIMTYSYLNSSWTKVQRRL